MGQVLNDEHYLLVAFYEKLIDLRKDFHIINNFFALFNFI